MFVLYQDWWIHPERTWFYKRLFGFSFKSISCLSLHTGVCREIGVFNTSMFTGNGKLKFWALGNDDLEHECVHWPFQLCTLQLSTGSFWVLDLILIMWGGHTEENWNDTQKNLPALLRWRLLLSFCLHDFWSHFHVHVVLHF